MTGAPLPPAPGYRHGMICLRTTSLVASLLAACGDSDAGSGSASGSATTTVTSTTGTSTTSTTGTTADPPTTGTTPSTTTASTTDTPTTTVDPSTGPSTTTSGETSTTTPGTTTTTSGDTSSESTSSTGGVSMPPPPPDMLGGCQTCECCDPWPISWGAVPGASEYVVRWKCSINPEQVKKVGNVTTIADVCNDIDMCNGMCVFTVGYIKVEACNDDGCSAAVNIPADLIPITCGGGCCC